VTDDDEPTIKVLLRMHAVCQAANDYHFACSGSGYTSDEAKAARSRLFGAVVDLKRVLLEAVPTP
jgi:outer membrane lipoprotein SlyB